jgi:MFS family permease
MSGWLSDRYGPKRVLMFATILHIISTLLEPLAADYAHHYISVGLRALLGFGFVRIIHLFILIKNTCSGNRYSKYECNDCKMVSGE